MNKKILLTISLIIIAGGAVFLLTRKEDPMVLQAKEETKQANETYLIFENLVNAIPSLQLSSDVKNDFKMEAAYFGLMGYIEPGKEGLSPTAMVHASKFITASNARASPKFSFDLDKDFGQTLRESVLIAEVTAEDVGFLEKTADTFDKAVKQAKSDAPELSPLTVERNKKTEKYFLEFDRIKQRLRALVATLDDYSSSDFRIQIEELRSANEVFSEVAQYISLLYQGKAWIYGLDISKTFPELANEEMAARNCAKYDPRVAPSGCEPIGFMPGKFQELLRKLETVYSALID